jgi:hypothetical protein
MIFCNKIDTVDELWDCINGVKGLKSTFIHSKKDRQ